MSKQQVNLNPCAKLSRPKLEQLATTLLFDGIELRRQRDDLLAALKQIIDASDKCSKDENLSLSDVFTEQMELEAKAAIAKVEDSE